MLANHLIDNFGQEIIYADLAERFGFGSSHTAENYVSYLKRTYLLLGIHKFSFKSKERIRNEKGYVVDTAFITERDDAMSGQNLGWKLENITYVELLRRIKCEKLTLITMNDTRTIEENGHTIRVISIIDWLLQE